MTAMTTAVLTGPLSALHVQLATGILELVGFRGELLADLLGNLHRAELRTAHRAEVRELGAVGGQGLVVELLRGVGIEREVKLITPAELEPRLGQRVVAPLRARVPLREVG